MFLNAHAYVVRGGAEALSQMLAMLEEDGIVTKGNPDVFVKAYTSFSIDEARLLRDRAALRAVGETGRTFVIAAPAIPADAQNALLKTFEEPPAGARFFLIVPSPETLLPTLLSRMQSLEIKNKEVAHPYIEARTFLKSTREKRIDMLKPLLEKDEDDKRDLAGTISFLSELERALAGKPKENREGLHAVYRARKYISDRGALSKTLLEQAALLIPSSSASGKSDSP